MKIRLTERQYSKLVKESSWNKTKDITPLVDSFIKETKGVPIEHFFDLFFDAYGFTIKDVENSKLLYNVLLGYDWINYTNNYYNAPEKTKRGEINDIIRIILKVEYNRIMSMGNVEQRFNNLTFLSNKYWGWRDTPEYSRILISKEEESKGYINFIKNTYSGVEAVKRLSLFNIKTGHKYRSMILDVIDNIKKENNIIVTPKSKGYTLNKRENSMVRQLIDYMKDIKTPKKTKRGFLSYIGSEYGVGQYSDFWSAANKSGIIEKVGGGSNVTYKLGPNYEAWEEGRVVAF